jgi:hypothetical protein
MDTGEWTARAARPRRDLLRKQSRRESEFGRHTLTWLRVCPTCWPRERSTRIPSSCSRTSIGSSVRKKPAPPNRSTTCRTRAATIHELPRRQRGSTLKGGHNKLFKRMREAPLYVIITLLCISPLGEAEERRKPYTCLLTSPYLTGPIKESGT